MLRNAYRITYFQNSMKFNVQKERKNTLFTLKCSSLMSDLFLCVLEKFHHNCSYIALKLLLKSVIVNMGIQAKWHLNFYHAISY